MLYQQLRAFHAVATEGGFTRAAAALHRTQPAVSAQVKALEGRYGVALFQRAGRGVAITEFGQRLLEITRRMFALQEEAEHALRSARSTPSGALRIAADAPYSLSHILALYCQRNPAIHVSVGMGTSESIVRDLLGRAADAAVLVRVQADPRLLALPYMRHRVVVVVRKDHAWAHRGSIEIGELQGKAMVLRDTRFSLTSQVFEEAIGERRVRPQVALTVDSRENLREAVAAGVAIGIAAEPDAIADRRLRAVAFRDLDLAICDYLVCLRERRDDAPVAALFALATAREPARRRPDLSAPASSRKRSIAASPRRPNARPPKR